MNLKSIIETDHWELIALIPLSLAPLFLGDWALFILTTYLLYSILALSLDIIWGYTGMISIGHAVFFGGGAYLSAILLRDYQSIPDLLIIFFVAPLIVGAFGLLIGYLIFKADLTGGAFAIVTILLTVAAQETAEEFAGITGGIGGLGNIPSLTVGSNYELSGMHEYYLAVMMLVIVYGGLKWLVNSPFGSVLTGIRDNKNRTEFLGYNTEIYRLIILTISVSVAGAAGALYAPVVGFLSPSEVGIALSTWVVIWVAVGGKGTLYGAVIGALFIQYAELYISGLIIGFWQGLIAIIFIGIILKAPDGLVGIIKRTDLVDEMRSSVQSAKAAINK